VSKHLHAQLAQDFVPDVAGVDHLDIDENPAEDHEAQEDGAGLQDFVGVTAHGRIDGALDQRRLIVQQDRGADDANGR
jgi:hypothetical protein